MNTTLFSDQSLQKIFNVQAWKYYSRFYTPYHRKIFLSITVSVIQSAIFLPIAYLIRYVFDEAIPSGNYYSLLLVGLAVVLLQMVNDGASLLISYLVLDITKKVIRSIREELVKKLYSFSRSYYTKADQGELHTIIVQDSERLDIMTYSLLAEFLPKLLITIVLLIILLALNWLLTLIVFISVPFVFITSRTMGKRLKKRTNLFHESFNAFSKGVMFVMQIMDLSRLAAAEKYEIQRQKEKYETLRRTSSDMSLFREVYYSVDTIIIATVSMIVLVAGGRSVATGAMSMGDLITFYAVVMFLRPRAEAISRSIPRIIEGNESLGRLFTFLDIDEPRPYHGSTPVQFEGKITLDAVSFSYAEAITLKNVSMVFEPGSKTAIFGPNGSGKTTVVNLILGFYRPQEGRLIADHLPYSEIELSHFRRQLAVVTQDPILFPGTIAENIAYGHPEKTLQEIIKAAELGSAHDFILDMAQGYETYIGTDGQLLSGGQRQRIAIARAFLNQPKLLILDEPTNHLDARSIEYVMNNVDNMSSVPTIILISHDLNIARKMDYIYMLENGSISDQGSFTSLFETLNLKMKEPTA